MMQQNGFVMKLSKRVTVDNVFDLVDPSHLMFFVFPHYQGVGVGNLEGPTCHSAERACIMLEFIF